MLRQRLNDDLKAAMKSRDQRATSALRLILAALKDRDIAARERGVTNGVDEPEIIDLLQKMVRQRQESITMYQKAARQELVDQEQGESRQALAAFRRALAVNPFLRERYGIIPALEKETGDKPI